MRALNGRSRTAFLILAGPTLSLAARRVNLISHYDLMRWMEMA